MKLSRGRGNWLYKEGQNAPPMLKRTSNQIPPLHMNTKPEPQWARAIFSITNPVIATPSNTSCLQNRRFPAFGRAFNSAILRLRSLLYLTNLHARGECEMGAFRKREYKERGIWMIPRVPKRCSAAQLERDKDHGKIAVCIPDIRVYNPEYEAEMYR